METFNFIELLKQMLVAVPIIMAAVILFGEALKGIFKKDLPKWATITIGVVLGMAIACGFVAVGKLAFGLGAWDYAIACVFGIFAGLAVEQIYSWDAVQRLIELIIEFFGNTARAIKAKFKRE